MSRKRRQPARGLGLTSDARLVVSERVLSKHDQISLYDARRIKADAQIGEDFERHDAPAWLAQHFG